MDYISPGVVTPITQNTIYALPTKCVVLFTDNTSPTIQQSDDSAFTSNVSVTLSGGQAEVSGVFLRCTSGDINVTLKSR